MFVFFFILLVIQQASCRSIKNKLNITEQQLGIVVDRHPDVSEYSISASGPFKHEATIDQLVIIDHLNVETLANTQQFTTRECRCHLKKLVDTVTEIWGDEYKLIITHAFSAIKRSVFREFSLHYEGRALDLGFNKLCLSDRENSHWRKTPEYTKLLQNLSWLAYKVAGFSFVETKNKHIHVSCSRKI